MRHFLLARPVAALPRGVREATGTAALIARPGGALRCASRGLRAGRAAVALPAIACAADHPLFATAGTVEQASGPIHRQGFLADNAGPARVTPRYFARNRASRRVRARHR